MEPAGLPDEWPKVDPVNIDPLFFCPKCEKIMFNPHQGDDCGCQYCFKCLDELLKQGSKCLSCHLAFASDHKIPDKYVLKKISNLVVKCVEADCRFTGKLSDYRIHYQEHSKNPKNNCPHCSKAYPSKELLAKHLDYATGDCKNQLFACPYEKLGCDLLKSSGGQGSIKKPRTDDVAGAHEKMDVESNEGKKTREDIENHLQANVKFHLDLLNFSTEKNIDALKKSISSMAAELDKARSGNMGGGSLDSSVQGEASGFLKSGAATYKDDMSMDIGDSTSSNARGQQIEDLKIQLSMIDTAQKAFSGDITKLLKNYHLLKAENEKQREMINEYKAQSQDLQKTQALTQVSMLALEERLINQEKVSYNGTLLWKITNVNERIQEAKQGRQTSFYSPPFYTSRNGFKMCARIYLNGDGNGRNTHLSLFFVLLRGESDSLLRWPFRQKVTFTLIDQSLSESKEHIIDAFRPDPNSSSFRRPISEMNIASGLPLFCPLAKLMSTDHEYIKDNTMFIKIIVDVKDLQEI